MHFTYTLGKDDIVYGLGENMGSINKRGRKYISFNTDDANHTPDMQMLYSSLNFFIVDGEKHFGAFFDTPSKVIFDIDSNCDGKLQVTCETRDLNLYIISGATSYEITKKFLKIVGKIEDFKSILGLRYRLLPYIYSEFMKALMSSDMFIKPLAFEFEDETSKKIDDQLLVGESIMVAPLIEQEKSTRMVYLPEDMTKVLYDGGNFNCTMLEKGWHKIKAKLNEVVFFIRNSKLVPVGNFAESTKDVDLYNVELLGNGKEYAQYIDDGQTKIITNKNIRLLKKN